MPSSLHDFWCGAAAGMLCRIPTHPLDTTKTVAFANDGESSRFVEAAQRIWQREGLKGFYRGVGIAVAGAAPGNALYFTSYEWLKQVLSSSLLSWTPSTSTTSSTSSSSSSSASNSFDYYKSRVQGLLIPLWTGAGIPLTCGFGAEAFSCLVWVPVDVTKERLQSQPPTLAGRYRNSWDALRTIIALEGVLGTKKIVTTTTATSSSSSSTANAAPSTTTIISKGGLYKGYLSTLASFGPFSAIYFMSYEWANDVLLQMAGDDSPHYSYSSPPFLKNRICNDAFTRGLVAGFCGNVISSVLTNPLELVKTRLQIQRQVLFDTNATRAASSSIARGLTDFTPYQGTIDGLVQLVKRHGVRGLWRGTGARIVYNAPNAALTMGVFRWLQDHTK